MGVSTGYRTGSLFDLYPTPGAGADLREARPEGALGTDLRTLKGPSASGTQCEPEATKID